MMWSEGLVIDSVTLKPSCSEPGDARGMTKAGKEPDGGQPALSRKYARCALAGSAAEHYLTGSWDEELLETRAYDIGRAKSYLVLGGGDWKPDALDYAIQTLANSVLDHIAQSATWHTITALAYTLMEKGEMTGKEVTAFLEEQ